MKSRGQRIVGLMLAGWILLIDCQPAHATAIALGSIAASNLRVTSPDATITFDPFTLLSFAEARNSLGQVDQQFDSSPSHPALATAAVSWANAHASSGDASWSAGSTVNLPAQTVGNANSQGQAQWFTSFMLSCPVASCGPSALVNFSADVNGAMQVTTDPAGESARAETIFNLNLDGTSLLFQDIILSIGSNDSQTQAFSSPLTASQSLFYDTPYSLQLRVDSESEASNTPEPSTLSLLGAGLAAAFCVRRRRRVHEDPHTSH